MKAQTPPSIWVLLADATEATEVRMLWFNLNDAPDHLYHLIKNNLPNTTIYENVHEGEGAKGLAGLVDVVLDEGFEVDEDAANE